MPEQIVNAKVVVGYYASEKQAEVAKSIIQDAGLGVTPLVKNLKRKDFRDIRHWHAVRQICRQQPDGRRHRSHRTSGSPYQVRER